MDKVYVMDNRGREKEATKIRYFKYNNNKYFVYTLDEIDNEGYVKLYIKKIVGDEDQPITDEEWPNVKEIVQEVFREIKAGTHYSYEDLNLNSISEIMDNGARVFKLKKTVIDDILAKEESIIKEDEDINTKLINGLKQADAQANNSFAVNQQVSNPNPQVNPFVGDNTSNSGDLNASLLDLLKRVEKVSEEENMFKAPDTLVAEDVPSKLTQPTEEFKIEDKIEEIPNNNEPKKLKPLVVGSVPVVKYQEQITGLEQELKEYKGMLFNLKKEIEQQRNINNRLVTQIESDKMVIAKYEERINHLKNIVKDM